MAFGVLLPLWVFGTPVERSTTLGHCTDLGPFLQDLPQRPGCPNITFSVERGQVVGLLGPNGSGKTTIMKSITGLAQPSEGTITVFGANVAHRE